MPPNLFNNEACNALYGWFIKRGFEKVKDGNGLFLGDLRDTAVLFTAVDKPYTSSGLDTLLVMNLT